MGTFSDRFTLFEDDGSLDPVYVDSTGTLTTLGVDGATPYTTPVDVGAAPSSTTPTGHYYRFQLADAGYALDTAIRWELLGVNGGISEDDPNINGFLNFTWNSSQSNISWSTPGIYVISIDGEQGYPLDVSLTGGTVRQPAVVSLRMYHSSGSPSGWFTGIALAGATRSTTSAYFSGGEFTIVVGDEDDDDADVRVGEDNYFKIETMYLPSGTNWVLNIASLKIMRVGDRVL